MANANLIFGGFEKLAALCGCPACRPNGQMTGAVKKPSTKHKKMPGDANLSSSEKRANAKAVLEGYAALARTKQAATAEELLGNTKAFNRLVDIEHRRQYQDWLPKARNKGTTIGGGAGALSGAAILGLATRKPALAFGAGAIGGIGGGTGGRVLGERMLENWDKKHGRGFVSKRLSAELEDRLLQDLRNESISSAVGNASGGQGILGSLGLSGLLKRPRKQESGKIDEL
jgi:hypothetical protein